MSCPIRRRPFEQKLAAQRCIDNIPGAQPLYCAGQLSDVPVARIDYKVAMIWHQDIRDQLERRGLFEFLDRLEEQPAIGLITEDIDPIQAVSSKEMQRPG